MSSIQIPSDRGREDPIYKPAVKPPATPSNAAVFIFVHGLADSAAAVENVGDQFQQGGKLPYMHWIIPNAKVNPVAMDTAWYVQNDLSPIAAPRPELVADEDEEGMLETVKYLESLIDACVEAGIPTNRIILGGFSQGCAMSLLLHLTSSKYGGKLGGIVGLLGYLPLCDGKERLQELIKEAGLDPKGYKVPLFLAKGARDPLIPKRVWNLELNTLKDVGIDESLMQVREYPGLSHTISGVLLQNLCTWLEKVVPDLE